jgi:hypothetical protein
MHDSTHILSVVAFASDTRRVRGSAFASVQPVYRSQLCLKLRNSVLARLMICFSDLSLWFSLPLSIWLSTGWVGLIFHWQAIARTACQVDVPSGDMMPVQQPNVGL